MTKKSLLNLHYTADEAHSGKIAIKDPSQPKATYKEMGIYTSGSMFYNLPTVEYAFDIAIMYIPVPTAGENLKFELIKSLDSSLKRIHF